MIHHATKKAAAKKGYRLQLSQHAPEGYKGAYSLQCFSDTSPERDFDLGSTTREAKENIKLIVKNL